MGRKCHSSKPMIHEAPTRSDARSTRSVSDIGMVRRLIFGKLTAKSHNLSGLDLVNRTRWVKEVKCRVPRNQTLHAIPLDSCTRVLFYILIF